MPFSQIDNWSKKNLFETNDGEDKISLKIMQFKEAGNSFFLPWGVCFEINILQGRHAATAVSNSCFTKFMKYDQSFMFL